MNRRPYDPTEYWESLLDEHFSVRGTAYAHLPRRMNDYLYRSQREAVARQLDRYSVRPSRVLDVGCGTGEWLRFWQSRGVGDLAGVDLTSAAVERGRRTFPNIEFLQADVSTTLKLDRPVDAVSAMSVLLHLTDEARFDAALRNIRGVLNPGGWLVAIDPVIVHRWWGPPVDEAANSRARTHDRWRKALREAGFAPTALRPATCLLANPADTRFKRTFHLLNLYWWAVGRIVAESDRRAAVVGAPLAAADRLLVRIARTGPSTKVLLARAI